MRTITWHGDYMRLIDQTLLPNRKEYVEVRDVDALIDAIRRLIVRGAPAIGVAGAFGVVLAAQHARKMSLGIDYVSVESVRIVEARPTAVNLSWAVQRVMMKLGDETDIGKACLVAEVEAMAILEEDILANQALAIRGADFVQSLVSGLVSVHTHCNAGGLACVEWGTALGIVRKLHERGRIHKVFADETRPLLQGARLTAYELQQMGIEHYLVVDGAGPSVIAAKLVDVVIVGADRVAANGDVANKIGTYPLALAANRAGIPFLVAAPESTIDPKTATGGDIQIELRHEDEILNWAGVRMAPEGSRGYNPAFDITPHDLITAVITEQRVVRLSSGGKL